MGLSERAPEQDRPEPNELNSILMDIAIYVVERDGRVEPNDYNWRLLVLRAKVMLESKALATGFSPTSSEPESPSKSPL